MMRRIPKSIGSQHFRNWNSYCRCTLQVGYAQLHLTAAIPNLKIQKSTPTLFSLQDVLLPLLRSIPASAPPEMAITMSRALILHISRLVDVASAWSKTTIDANGEQNAILTELIQTAVMIFGPNVFADLTQRWFLAVFPRYAGLHEERDWQPGQAALDAALVRDRSTLIDTAYTSPLSVALASHRLIS